MTVLSKYEIDKFDGAVAEIRDSLVRTFKRMEECQKTLDEYNKDEEIRIRDEQIRELQMRTFCFDQEDWKKISAFADNHRSMNDRDRKQPSHSISYRFTPFELGTFAEAECSCGKKIKFLY